MQDNRKEERRVAAGLGLIAVENERRVSERRQSAVMDAVRTDGSGLPIEQPKPAIFHVVLEEFEKLVYSRQHEAAGMALVSALVRLRGFAGFAGHPKRQFEDEELAQLLYTRFCSAVAALFLDPVFEVSPEGFSRLAAMQPALEAAWRLSEYGTSDHVLFLLSDNPMERDPNKLKFGTDQTFAKAFLIWCTGSSVSIDFDELFSKASRLLFPWWLSLVSHITAIGEKQHERYEELIGMGHHFDKFEVSGMELASLSDAYMHCSYAVRQDKHNLKKELSRLCKYNFGKRIGAGFRDGMEVRAQGRRPLGGEGGERPVMAFPLEWWTSVHAMYRCYHPVVMQMREHFRCVAFVRPEAIDARGRESFDEVVEVGSGKGDIVLQGIVDSMKAVRPDVVYYLSAGMAQWWTAIASVRVAPIQMLSLGHPATSGSTEIDYVLVDEGLAVGPGVFTETVLELPPNALRFEHRSDKDEELVQSMRKQPGIYAGTPFRVAVPAMLAKVRAPFVSMLLDVYEESNGQVEYHFFPNTVGMGQLLARKELHEVFPDSIVHQRQDYFSYLKDLSGCDLHASPFPFGGTNSNLDSMQLGLPILVLDGPREPHERYDAAMLRRAGLTDLIAGGKEHYKELLLRLINDHRFYAEQLDKALRVDVEGKFFAPLSAPAEGSFARAALFAYRNHSAELRRRHRVGWREILTGKDRS